MKSIKHDILLRLVKLADLIMVTLLFMTFWMHFYAPNMWVSTFYRRGNWVMTALFALLFYLFGRTYDAFQVSIYHISEMIYSQAIALLFSDFLMLIVIWLLLRHIPPILPMFLLFALQMLVATVWAVIAHGWYFSHFSPKKTLVIYDMREGMETLISDYGLEKKFKVERVCQVKKFLKEGAGQVADYEVVYLCGIHSHDRNIILKKCIEENVSVYLIPRIGDVIMSGARNMHMLHLPVMRVSRYSPMPEYLIVKRLMDVLLSGLFLIVLSPLMLILAFLIRRDGGPAFYRQVRLTKDGKEFEVLKFRSMRVDAEKDGVARLSSGDQDDRITPVGKFIRKVRLDELPQLINIVKGDMSIVGPRPERPEIAAQYEEELPEFHLRLQAKAGLTGMAQIYGKYNTTPYDKLMMDLMYIAHPSIVEDLRLMCATVKILFLPESTEGVAEGATTAMGFEDDEDGAEEQESMAAK